MAAFVGFMSVATWGCANGGDGALNGGVPGSDAGDDPGAVGDTGPELECAPEDPPLPPESLEPCELCEGARCVPNFALDDEQLAMLAPCNDTSSCVPDLFIETNGNFTLQKCTSVNGAEGRCLSPCIPDVADQLDLLPQDVCEGDWLCAPCYDPRTGEDTGACTQGCDEGPTEDPITFADCCDGGGKCVPSDLVPSEQQEQLDSAGCDDSAGELCAPNVFVEEPDWSPPSCDPGDSGDPLFAFSSDGRCMPECVPDVSDPPFDLEFNQSTCEDGFLCTPCTVTGFWILPVETGACDL